MKELMLHVEKIVRPLRMSGRHKLRMREELLGHLRGIYDEELERVDNHGSAADAAIARFGQAGEISNKLKASIPWYDFVFGWPRSATVPRLTLFILVVTIVFELPILSFVSRIFSGHWFGLEQLAVYGFVLLTIPLFASYGLGLAGASFGILGHCKAGRCVVFYTVGFFSYLTRGSLLMNWPHPVFQVLYPVVWTRIIAAGVHGFGHWVQNAECRLREWDSLELETSP
jgi:hypothetical protein